MEDDFDEYCPIGDSRHQDPLTKDPARNMHCRCWYDGDGCCRCLAPAMTHEQKVAQGMEDE
jgi:hypothetical protein